MRFLIVDDGRETRLLLRRVLEPYGTISIAADGEECILAFSTALREQRPYYLVTMDILMPNLDGPDALREIREIEAEYNIPAPNRTPVIMVSGLENSEEVQNAYPLGSAVGYIEKPINTSKLLKEIANLGITLTKAK